MRFQTDPAAAQRRGTQAPRARSRSARRWTSLQTCPRQRSCWEHQSSIAHVCVSWLGIHEGGRQGGEIRGSDVSAVLHFVCR